MNTNTPNILNNPFAEENSPIDGENAIPVQQGANNLEFDEPSIAGINSAAFTGGFDPFVGGGFDPFAGEFDPFIGGGFEPGLIGFDPFFDPFPGGGGFGGFPIIEEPLGGIGGGDPFGGLGGGGLMGEPLIGSVHNPNHFEERMAQLDREYYEQMDLIWG